MPLNKRKIQKIMKKYKKDFDELEHYDKTREKLLARDRIYITLQKRLINRLKELKQKTGKPISRLIEEKFLSQDRKIR